MNRTRFLALILLLLLCFTACGSQGIETSVPPEEQTEAITAADVDSGFEITVNPLEGVGFDSFTSEDLGGNYSGGFAYSGLSEVNIHIGSETLPLHEAIRDSLITVEEIVAQAKIDASDRSICKMDYSTEFGVTTFVYHYFSGYDIVYRHDVLEAPNGEEYLLEDFVITEFGGGDNIHLGWQVYNEDGTLTDLIAEDWGIAFSVSEASPTSLTVAYTQQDGCQAGMLTVSYFNIYHIENSNWNLAVQPDNNAFSPITLASDTSDMFTLDLSVFTEELSSGNYVLWLQICDVYEKTQLHPYQTKYKDIQSYQVMFTVP